MKSFFFSLCLLGPGLASAASLEPVAAKIDAQLNRAVELVTSGQLGEAQSAVSDAYFELFEGQGMETIVGARSPQLKTTLENRFNQLRGLISSGATLAEVTRAKTALSDQLDAVAMSFDSTQSRGQSFLSSFLIIFREGFEAILIVGAIVAFLLKTGNRSQMGIVRSSILTAILASIATAVVFKLVVSLSSAERELMEGLTMLVACAVLFTVGHWLVSQAESNHWQSYIKSHLKESLSFQSKRALWLTCFLAVYREGAEIVLFYQALITSSGPGQVAPLVAGFGVGCVVLAIVYVAFKKGVLRIPMRPFFRVTSTLLYFLAFVFAGKAIIELQSGGYVGVKLLKHMPTIEFLGLYPTAQSMALQGALLLAFVVSLSKVIFDKRAHAALERG